MSWRSRAAIKRPDLAGMPRQSQRSWRGMVVGAHLEIGWRKAGSSTAIRSSAASSDSVLHQLAENRHDGQGQVFGYQARPKTTARLGMDPDPGASRFEGRHTLG